MLTSGFQSQYAVFRNPYMSPVLFDFDTTGLDNGTDRWIQDYLNGWIQRTVSDGLTLSWKELMGEIKWVEHTLGLLYNLNSNGVLLGSVFGPMLLNIF